MVTNNNTHPSLNGAKLHLGDPGPLFQAEGGFFELCVRLSTNMQFHEPDVALHLRRVAKYVELLAEALGRPAEDVQLLKVASVFHDVGMAEVPTAIVSKNGPLTPEEAEIVRRHTEIGHQMLSESGVPMLEVAAMLALTHHEYVNGKGYPHQLVGLEIPLGGRILAVADVFDALTTRRPYKEPYPIDVAVDIINGMSGKQFDAEVVVALQQRVDLLRDVDGLPSRTLVNLSSSALAEGMKVDVRQTFAISARDMNKGELFASGGYFSCPFCKQMHPQGTTFCSLKQMPLREIHQLSGQVINEKYLLQRAAGAGGMASVYESLHMLTNRRVALKLLDPDVARNPSDVTRFLEEGRVFATVGHPNLVEVLDIDQTPEGVPFMVMEYLVGEDLADFIEAECPISEVAAASVLVEVLRTLTAVHGAGIVHRDLKPENIFLTQDRQRLKILDFGISLVRDSHHQRPRLTKAGTFMGTPEYMSPEQAYGLDSIDHRSDLFTMGEILYELVTGWQTFTAETTMAVMMAVANVRYVHPATRLPGLSSEMVAVILRSLRADKEARYQTTQEFIDDLMPILERDFPYQPGVLLGLHERGAKSNSVS
ncbi:MAG: hypothetical protein AUK47_18835 [Deltaproteobacteria bacterium CG2_30_63_29]|nr:MAG: hypothetical protein AUK47_18835 [Deltaproteobacteria bacterium CG2_30_63_29]